MSEYELNLDFGDVFNCFALNREDSSQILQLHSHYELPSGQQGGASENELIEKEVPTSDRNASREARFAPLPAAEAKPTSSWLEYEGEVRNRNEAVRQGSKDDTVELNINFKTIIYNHFKELQQANELSPAQQRRLGEFGSRSPSFKSLLLFCSPDPPPRCPEAQIWQLCTAFVESALIVRRILESKCRMPTKLNMIKFVEVLRRNVRGDGRITRWKQSLRS